MEKQYYYLIAHKEDKRLFPDKIFLQEYEAIKWGRTLATNTSYKVLLYKQEITRNGVLKFIKELNPFSEQ